MKSRNVALSSSVAYWHVDDIEAKLAKGDCCIGAEPGWAVRVAG
jgi:hypothetical protein